MLIVNSRVSRPSLADQFPVSAITPGSMACNFVTYLPFMPDALGYKIFNLYLHWRKVSTPLVRDDTTIPLTSIASGGFDFQCHCSTSLTRYFAGSP